MPSASQDHSRSFYVFEKHIKISEVSCGMPVTSAPGQFGTGAEVSRDTLAPVPKCLGILWQWCRSGDDMCGHFGTSAENRETFRHQDLSLIHI